MDNNYNSFSKQPGILEGINVYIKHMLKYKQD